MSGALSASLPEDQISEKLAEALQSIPENSFEKYVPPDKAADNFERSLTKTGAQLVTQSATIGLMYAIDEVARGLVDSWRFLFLIRGAIQRIPTAKSIR